MAIKRVANKTYKIRVVVEISGKRKELNRTIKQDTIGQAKVVENELRIKLLTLKKQVEDEENRYTWNKALNDYLEYSKGVLKYSTWYDRQTSLKAHTTILIDKELKDISKADIRSIVDNLKGTISHKKKVLKHIKQVFKHSLDERKISYNPCNQIILSGDKNARERANKLEAMSQDEVNSVLKFLKDSNHPWYIVFFIAYQLGLRSSESVALEYEDIDWDNKYVTISKSWCRRTNRFVPPKNGQSRIIPLNNQTYLFLRELALNAGYSGFVLPRFQALINGNATRTLNEIQSHLNIKKTNFHSLRASFITHLLKNGIPVIKVQAMVGHNDLATTQRYIRLAATDLDNATINLQIDYSTIGKVLAFPKEAESI